MAFFVTMFICNLLIPLVMVIGGYCMGKNPTQKINGVAGYRTKRSKMNMDTWLFAHRLCGKLWVRLGAVLLVLSPHIQEDSEPLQVGDELAQCYEEEHVV